MLILYIHIYFSVSQIKITYWINKLLIYYILSSNIIDYFKNHIVKKIWCCVVAA